MFKKRILTAILTTLNTKTPFTLTTSLLSYHKLYNFKLSSLLNKIIVLDFFQDKQTKLTLLNLHKNDVLNVLIKPEKTFRSTTQVYPQFLWLEREYCEFQNVNFVGTNDTRNLLLPYSLKLPTNKNWFTLLTKQ